MNATAVLMLVAMCVSLIVFLGAGAIALVLWNKRGDPARSPPAPKSPASPQAAPAAPQSPTQTAAKNPQTAAKNPQTAMQVASVYTRPDACCPGNEPCCTTQDMWTGLEDWWSQLATSKLDLTVVSQLNKVDLVEVPGTAENSRKCKLVVTPKQSNFLAITYKDKGPAFLPMTTVKCPAGKWDEAVGRWV